MIENLSSKHWSLFKWMNVTFTRREGFCIRSQTALIFLRILLRVESEDKKKKPRNDTSDQTRWFIALGNQCLLDDRGLEVQALSPFNEWMSHQKYTTLELTKHHTTHFIHSQRSSKAFTHHTNTEARVLLVESGSLYLSPARNSYLLPVWSRTSSRRQRDANN